MIFLLFTGSPNVGGVKIDAIRNIWGQFSTVPNQGNYSTALGIEQTGLWVEKYNASQGKKGYLNATSDSDRKANLWVFDASRVVPTGAVNRPRSLAVLACAYMGIPAL